MRSETVPDVVPQLFQSEVFDFTESTGLVQSDGGVKIVVSAMDTTFDCE